jgi:hypothetical protein
MRIAKMLSFVMFFCLLANIQEVTAQKKTLVSKPITKTVTGTFVKIEQGDYFYLILNKNGEDVSIRVDKPDVVYKKLDGNPETFVGRKIKVVYETKKINVPEAGGMMEVDLYIKGEIQE